MTPFHNCHTIVLDVDLGKMYVASATDMAEAVNGRLPRGHGLMVAWVGMIMAAPGA